MVNVVFIHPDLGIGGAERLIVDAALALKQKGHSINILTSHHNLSHCFDETRDGTLSVSVYGDWLPRNICGLGTALFAYIRMCYLAICLLLTFSLKPSVIICDQVSVPIPLLKLKTSTVIFYCHFPDQLLSTGGGTIKQFYRRPLDWIEEYTTGKATKIFVNSKFTASVFLKTFKTIETVPDVLYPSLHTQKFDITEVLPVEQILNEKIPINKVIFLSLNRYERKKNILLAAKSFAHLKQILSPTQFEKCHLVIAGGYDKFLDENIEHFLELKSEVHKLNLVDKVTFLKSPSDSWKMSLLKHSTCLLYTPSNEHFGIVPLEAMYLETPVIAVNNGGPTETVVDGVTGYLRNPVPEDFADAMANLVRDEELAKRLGAAGKKRVINQFSFEEFARQLDTTVKRLAN